jgi:hypothetical protein
MKVKVLTLLGACLLSSCSVYKAACKDGADIQEVQSSHTRNEFLNLGARVVSSERLPTGELVETYQIPKARGSAARSVMHGLLDLSTCFIWEVAGTPIEYSLDKQEFITVKVTFGPDDIAKKAELL